MNYYQFHIGDFNSATRHLTLVERSLYRDLIDMYYDTERAIDGSDFDRLARRLMCRTDDEKTALQYVLDEFFTLDGDLYTHERCEREIQEYQAKREQQSRAGKASAEKRLNKKSASDAKNQTSVEGDLTNVERTLNEPSTNHKPLTNNQEPIISSSGSSVREEKIEQSNFQPQKNVIAGYATYHTDDPTLYSLIEAEQADLNLVENFIEQAKASYPMHKLTPENYNELFQKLRQWSLEKRVGQTRQKWMNSWLTIVKNNAHTFAESPEKPSHFKNSRQAEKPKHRYGTGVVKQSEQQDQMRDVVGVIHE